MPSSPAPLPPVHRRTVVVDGARVRLVETGPADGDPLLFLHGWGMTPATYADGLRRLTSAGVRVLAPALPGFGGSDGPGLLEIDLAEYATRVGRLLDVLDLGVPVFVAGHSFGGGVALQLATDRPDLVRSLTLLNSVGGAPGGGGLSDGSWPRWAVRALAELHPRDLLRSAPAMVRAVVPNLVRRPVTLALTARLALTASLAPQARALVDRGLPVLFVWSDRDTLIGRGQLRDVLSALPAEVVRGRHGWLLSRPEEFATLLRNALVVHAMLERRRRGSAVVLPAGTALRDLLPRERRRTARLPSRRPAARAGT